MAGTAAKIIKPAVEKAVETAAADLPKGWGIVENGVYKNVTGETGGQIAKRIAGSVASKAAPVLKATAKAAPVASGLVSLGSQNADASIVTNSKGKDVSFFSDTVSGKRNCEAAANLVKTGKAKDIKEARQMVAENATGEYLLQNPPSFSRSQAEKDLNDFTAYLESEDTISNSVKAQANAKPGDVVNGKELTQGDINWAKEQIAPTTEAKAEAKAEPKAEAKTEAKAEPTVKAEAKAEAKAEPTVKPKISPNDILKNPDLKKQYIKWLKDNGYKPEEDNVTYRNRFAKQYNKKNASVSAEGAKAVGALAGAEAGAEAMKNVQEKIDQQLPDIEQPEVEEVEEEDKKTKEGSSVKSSSKDSDKKSSIMPIVSKIIGGLLGGKWGAFGDEHTQLGQMVSDAGRLAGYTQGELDMKDIDTANEKDMKAYDANIQAELAQKLAKANIKNETDMVKAMAELYNDPYYKDYLDRAYNFQAAMQDKQNSNSWGQALLGAGMNILGMLAMAKGVKSDSKTKLKYCLDK